MSVPSGQFDLWHWPQPGTAYWEWRCVVCNAPVHGGHATLWQRIARWWR